LYFLLNAQLLSSISVSFDRISLHLLLYKTRLMRRILCSAVLLFSFIISHSQTDTFTVVNWNIEWFGSTTNGPSNENQQEANVVKILRYLNADLYGLNEVVDTLRLRRVVDSLGSNYGFYISGFGSAASSPLSPNWSTAQKLAFIYKKDVFSNIKTRAMLNNGSNAYFNFASGRFPYLFNANTTKNGKKRNISFILIHAKAGATAADFNRRKSAAVELKDTLDPLFANHPMILMGDYNDELEGSIVNGYTVSPYDVLVRDSIKTNSNYYHSITLLPERAGERSTISFTNVIDHQMINKRMDSMYVPSSADIRQDVINVVPDYLSRTTSDHYPVSSKYVLINGDTSVVIVNPPPPPPQPNLITGFKVGPNPFDREIFFRSGKTLNNVVLTIYNSIGQKVWQNTIPVVTSQFFNEIQLPFLPSGLYIFQINSKEESFQFKLLK
jgi:endonuclease/exonuclease/phosphatase family metal-dependent hydrolase